MRLFRHKRSAEDFSRELQAHLEFETDRLQAEGFSYEEAQAAARRAFGNLTTAQERFYESGRWRWSDQLVQDLRYSLRLLARSPGFASIAILSLTLGIGANTAVFSVFDAVMLKALPVRGPGQLRILSWVRNGDPAGLRSHSGYTIRDERGRSVSGSFSYPAYEMLRRTLPQFSDLVAFAQNQFAVTAAGSTDLASGQFVSGNYFTSLGVEALMGRPILPGDDAAGKPRVAVLTNAYWNRRFGSDPQVIGRTVLINRQPTTVVGVLPPAFQGLLPGRMTDLFVPISMAPATTRPDKLSECDNWWVQIFGRLKPGISDEVAAMAAQSALRHHIESYAGAVAASNKPVTVVLEPGNRGVGLSRGALQTSIDLLVATAGLVLLIACVNLSNLLLARYSARAREIAIRMSIGAGRGRLVRQMLTESLLLAILGALGGLLLARPLLQLLVKFLLGGFTLGINARLDFRALWFTLAVSVVTALLIGTVPAWRATRLDAGPGLKEGPGNLVGHRSRGWLGPALVSLQIALSLLLMVGTGLFLRTLQSLAAVELGFQTEHMLTFQTDPGRSGYPAAQMGEVYRRLEARLAAIPGVESVGMSHQGLITGSVSNGPVRLPGFDEKGKQTWFLYCSDSFLSTLRIAILHGRDLTPADFDRNQRTAVVNETFVKRYLPGIDPIGRIFYAPSWDRHGNDPQPFTIVGVAKDAHYRSVRDEAPPTAYLPYALRPSGITSMTFVIRTRLAPLSLAPAVRRAVAGVDANLPVAELQTEQDQIERSLGSERLFATLVSTFGAIAVVLAAIGLYGVMAFSVGRRAAEIGIRVALGAGRRQVRWLVLRQSLAMAAGGIAAGVPAALGLSGLVQKLLYGVTPTDPVSVGGAVAVMLTVAGCAAWLPARRASAIDPMAALKYE